MTRTRGQGFVTRRCGVETIVGWVKVILETVERKAASRDWSIYILMVTKVYIGSAYTGRYSAYLVPTTTKEQEKRCITLSSYQEIIQPGVLVRACSSGG